MFLFLRALLIATLRWPSFPKLCSELERPYERAAWHPLRLRGTGPTGAATQLIACLAAANTLGLEPAGYDAERLDLKAREFVTQRRTLAS